MKRVERLICCGASMALTIGVGAQVMPLCCRYTMLWPPASQPPAGACSGEYSVACEDRSPNCTGQSSACLQKRPGTRPVECCLIELGAFDYFIRGGCDDPPEPGAIFIGQLDDGSCCWVGDSDTSPSPSFTCTERDFHVNKCEVLCEEDEVPP